MCYTQPPSLPPTKYADALYARSCKLADVYDEAALNDIFIEIIDSSICHSVWKYWASTSQADLTDVALKAQSPLAILNGRTKSTHAGN